MVNKSFKLTVSIILALMLINLPVMASQVISSFDTMAQGGMELAGVLKESGDKISDDPETGSLEANIPIIGIPVIAAEIDTIDASYAAAGDLISLDNIGISIRASGYALVEEDDGFVYVETKKDSLYPYVIIGVYDLTSNSMVDDYTDYMSQNYPDISVEMIIEGYKINEDNFDKVVYSYTVGETRITDTRLFYELDDKTYMFGSKESEEAALTLPEGYLDSVADSFRMLSDDPDDYALHVNETDSVTGPGAASSDPLGEISFTEDAATYEGVWIEFDDPFKMYLPVWWEAAQFTEEEIEDGYYYLAYDPTTGSNEPFIQIDWNYNENGYTLEGLTDVLLSNGNEVDGKIIVNGITCVSFAAPQYNMQGFVFLHPLTDKVLFQVVAYPCTQENYDTLASAMCSLTPTN